MKILVALWQILDRKQRNELLLLQCVSVLMAFSTVGGIAAILPFFTVLMDTAAIERSAALDSLYRLLPVADERAFVVVLGLAFVAVAVLSSAVNLVGSLAISRFAYRAGDEFRIALLEEYLHRGYGFHLRTSSSTLASNVLVETGRVTSGILQSSMFLTTNLLTIALILASLLIVNPLIAVAALAGLGSSYALTYALARRRLLRNGRLESSGIAQRAKVVQEALASIKEVILRQAQPSMVERFAGFTRAVSHTTVNTLAIAQFPKHALECMTVVCLVGVALYLNRPAQPASDWVAQLSFTGLAAYRLLPALQQAFSALVRIRADRPAFDNVVADLKHAKTNGWGKRPPVQNHFWCGRPRQEVRFDNVSYRHTPERSPAIAGVTLHIPAGTTIGLLGANGSGKTTFADLLAGLLLPDEGRVLIDGIALDETNRRAWQSTIAYVPQEIFLFDATLAENIAFGVPAGRVDRERVAAVIRLASLEKLVADLPRGHEELLGERGLRLSGGQRQRIGIARALYRESSLLILDEATNELDGLVEQELLGTIDSLRGKCTIVLIAHRLSTARHCDMIFEFENGRVSGGGSYEQQIRKSERLRRIAELSA